jgi:putative ABC transport system permease protein
MMSMTLIKIAAQSMRKNKLRTLLTMLGIIIGVGAVILMMAIGMGAKHQIEVRIANLGTNMIVITPGSNNQSAASQGAQSMNTITLEDAQVLQKQSYLLAAVSPVVVTRAQIVGGAGNWRTGVFGVDTGYLDIRGWPLESGVFFEDTDIQAMRKLAVLGATVAASLFPAGDAVGQQIRVRDEPFTVVGVLTAKGQTAQGSDQDDIVLAPYTTVKNRLSGFSHIAQILANTGSSGDISGAESEIRAILRESHHLGSNEADDFTVRNQDDLTQAAQGTTEVMTLLLSAIAGISLLVGGIGIMNIMFVSVTERTREIGLRMALGARGSDVLLQFLVESVVISLAGGLLGVALGFAGGAILGKITGWSTVISPATVAMALGFAGGVGIFFGFYPARRAAALEPIQALRYE